jgi:hypothetical protein
MDIIELEAQRQKWSKENFPKANAISCLAKMDEEMLDLEVELFQYRKDVDKYAGALMCLLDSAARAGFDAGEIFKAVEKKFEINKGLTWKLNADNTYSPVTEKLA